MTAAGAHDSTLVALSILVATAASYTALDLAGRVRASEGWAARAWLATAAFAMGGGIWAMHFVAMLAFTVPGMEAHYDFGLTALSLAVPILVTGIGFAVVRRGSGPAALGFSGLLMGAGIAAMHYTGMAAMHVPATLAYEARWVAVSILVAVGASTAALWLAFRNAGVGQRLAAAAAMGLAVSGMHYAAMEGASFTPHPAVDGGRGVAGMGQVNLALAVAAATFLILFLALVAAMFDRRFGELAEREAAALRRSEERFRALYRRTPLPLHALDEAGRIEQVSDAWLDLLGYARDEVEGRPLVAFMTEDSGRRRLEEDWPRLLAEGELRDGSYRLVARDGRLIDVISSARVERDEAGRFERVLGGVVDVTARRLAEEALRQAQKNEAVGQLTGGVAHDFNNLLAVIVGNLDLLKRRMGPDPKLSRLVENALRGAERGVSLTQRMLAFARKQDLTPEPVAVPDLVRGIEDLLRHSAGPQMRIETRFPLGLPRALADANQLELALLNLVVNARDAMPAGGTITIAARVEGAAAGHAPDLPPGDYLCLSVSDTGLGMDEATLAKAMEPFFTTKGVGKGTGLGLSMVHGLAQQLGGSLRMSSRPGEGTTAEIRLPVAEPAPAARPERGEAAAPGPAPATRPLVVLAVDDDALVLANTAAMLGDLGHEVLEAGSGPEALEILRAGAACDLVITDQAMPGMTGVQLAATVRAERPGLPVLLVTGYAELPPEALAGLPRLLKPFRQDALARTLADLSREPPPTERVLPFRPRRG